MSLVKWAFIGLLLLPLAEIMAFILIAVVIGWLWTICLFLATTLVGIAVLKRAGRRDLDRLRTGLARDGAAAVRLDSPSLGPLIGGILLVFPGFITDLVGILLLVPAVRRCLGTVMRRTLERRHGPQKQSVVDLTPEEWHQVSEKSIEDGQPHKRIR
jgi:UPF0716 protein FxsA